MLTDIYLESTSHFSIPLTDSNAELTLKMKKLMPNIPRRINRCIQVSLLGAFDCMSGHAGKAVDVCLCSPSIGVSVMADLLESVVNKKEQPKPISFIHSIGNAATFYVSKNLDLRGESLFLAQTTECLAHMLLLTAVKMNSGNKTILLGRVRTGSEFTECSWLLLTKTPTENSLTKLSFESLGSEGSTQNAGSTCHIADFKQFAERPSVAGYIGGAEFQQQAGLIIRVD